MFNSCTHAVEKTKYFALVFRMAWSFNMLYHTMCYAIWYIALHCEVPWYGRSAWCGVCMVVVVVDGAWGHMVAVIVINGACGYMVHSSGDDAWW